MKPTSRLSLYVDSKPDRKKNTGALALDKIQQITGWGWDYQVPVYGGRQIRGGNVVDFLIYTPGMWTIPDPRRLLAYRTE